MQYFLDQSINGISLGCMYAFIALGYTMVYGVLRLINFAHGEFFMVGGIAGYLCAGRHPAAGWSLPAPLPAWTDVLLSVATGAITGGAVAVICEGLIYRPLRGEGRTAALLATGYGVLYGWLLWTPISRLSIVAAAAGLAIGTWAVLEATRAVLDRYTSPRPPGSRISALLAALGLSLVLQNAAVWIFTATPRAWPEPRSVLHWEELERLDAAPADLFYLDDGRNRQAFAAGEPITPQKLEPLKGRGVGLYFDALPGTGWKNFVSVGALAISGVLLYVLVKHHKVGKAMRALSWNVEAARLMGIDPNRVIAFTFFLGGTLAGVGGVLWGLRYGKVEPYMGFLVGLKAFTAAVLGGIGSIPGAVLGGLLLGWGETLFAAYGFSAYRDGFAFVGLIVLLLIRPTGLLGVREGEKL
jgi:branched-chain amino acid transport system permease protein